MADPTCFCFPPLLNSLIKQSHNNHTTITQQHRTITEQHRTFIIYVYLHKAIINNISHNQ